MFLLVPGKQIRQLFPVGLVGGFVLALLLVYVMQNLLGLWSFRQADFLIWGRIPLFLSAAWIPLEIIFGHLLTQYKKVFLMVVLIIGLPAGATFIHYLMIKNQMLFYRSWNLGLTFLVSLGIHLAIGLYLYYRGWLAAPAKVR